MDGKEMKGIFLQGSSDLDFVFIHGYTGNVDDFVEVPQLLHEKFNVSVSIPLLPGHGTTVDDLLDVSLEELMSDTEKCLASKIAEGKKVVLIGFSLGAQIALYLASKYSVSGVIAIATTHTFKFPLNLPGIPLLLSVKKTWRKFFFSEELPFRKNSDYYLDMPSKGFFISRELHDLVEDRAGDIHAPVLFLHSTKELLGDPNSISMLKKKLGSKKIIVRLIKSNIHNMFYSNIRNMVIDEITLFLNPLLSKQYAYESQEKASAIIPAYNEAERIGEVVQSLLKAHFINEIIVVDDGSKDTTADVVHQFPQVKYIRNAVNIGKGGSMNIGVQTAKNDVLFFCDADLIGFRAEHADAIIRPIIDDVYDMYIGMRGNFMQRTVTAWGLNSGERALRKKVWFALPPDGKYRFRVEAALNDYVKKHTQRGFGWQMCDYSQTLKEKKYGFIKGTFFRWWMNSDVFLVYIKSFLVDFFSKILKSLGW